MAREIPFLVGLPRRLVGAGLELIEADSRAARMKGLSGQPSMPVGVALHIPKCFSVHTFTMRFPLDLLWLDRRGNVVRVDRDVAPRRIKTCLRARSVIEANAGEGAAFERQLARDREVAAQAASG